MKICNFLVKVNVESLLLEISLSVQLKTSGPLELWEWKKISYEKIDCRPKGTKNSFSRLNYSF
jgi:hypothetical protein